MSILIIAAIALAVLLGYKTKINIGLLFIAFAYIIGCFMLGMTAKDLIAKWPVGIMFVVLGISLFYNFAAVNGTLEKISDALLYACRRFPGMLPFVLFAAATLLSVMGAAYLTVLEFLLPITLVVCKASKMHTLTGVAAINFGALAGGSFPTAALGALLRSLTDAARGAGPAPALEPFSGEIRMFGLVALLSMLLLAVFCFGIKANRNVGAGMTFKKPEPFTPKQRMTLNLMLMLLVVVLVFPMMGHIPTGNGAVAAMGEMIHVGLVAVVFAIVALLLDLAPQQEVIARVPWNTIIMIGGAGMLISVAVTAGTGDALSIWIRTNVPLFFVPTVLGFAAVSLFGLTAGVAAPALVSLISALSAVPA